MSKYNREAIIDKGIELMRKNGYHGTGVQHVLKACGIPKGSFYNFFESKQDFALQAIEKYGDDNLRMIRALNDRLDVSALQKVELFFGDLEKFYRSKKFELTCLMSILSLEVGSEDPLIASKIKSKFDDLKKILATIIKTGQESEEIRTDWQAANMSDFLINSFNGALITMKYEKSSRAIRQFKSMCLPLLRLDT
ncbi:MAG: TetR/AcrR family transcriptional regulator [Saprospiraceae bacterium]|nr:TetR/AcrR family transcriptional regulator [Saprospiraceae bacterium]